MKRLFFNISVSLLYKMYTVVYSWNIITGTWCNHDMLAVCGILWVWKFIVITLIYDSCIVSMMHSEPRTQAQRVLGYFSTWSGKILRLYRIMGETLRTSSHGSDVTSWPHPQLDREGVWATLTWISKICCLLNCEWQERTKQTNGLTIRVTNVQK